jgi:hypothetical protein
MIVDCHVNIWNHDQVTPLWREQMARVRPDGAPGLLADADTLHQAMQDVFKAIVFPIRYGDSGGVDLDLQHRGLCRGQRPHRQHRERGQQQEADHRDERERDVDGVQHTAGHRSHDGRELPRGRAPDHQPRQH